MKSYVMAAGFGILSGLTACAGGGEGPDGGSSTGGSSAGGSSTGGSSAGGSSTGGSSTGGSSTGGSSAGGSSTGGSSAGGSSTGGSSTGGSSTGGSSTGGSSTGGGTSSDVTLTLIREGSAASTGVVDYGAFNCPSDCEQSFPKGTVITLTASGSLPTEFTSWGGACSGSASDCSIILNENTNVSANFEFVQHVVTVATTGSGGGVVTSSVGGIDCGVTCEGSVIHGESVTLTAVPDEDSQFLGWAGEACSGTDPCQITIEGAESVSAEFAPEDKRLQIYLTGNAAELAQVTSDVGGLDCPGTCAIFVPHGQELSVTAIEHEGVDFTGWSGATSCTNELICPIDGGLTQDRVLFPEFTLQKRALNVSIDSGVGTVLIKDTAPSAIDCPGSCSAEFDYGSTVTLVATPGMGHAFAGWSGACAGVAPECTVLLEEVQNVGVDFTENFYAVDVALLGAGVGGLDSLVTEVDAGFECHADGAGCQIEVGEGTPMTFTVHPPAWAYFAGWEGDCSGTDLTCDLIISAETSISARFSPRGNLAFVSPVLVHGDLGGLSGADGLCEGWADDYDLPGDYVAWLSSSTVSALDRLQAANSNPAGWFRTDGIAIAAGISDLTDGWLSNPIAVGPDATQGIHDWAATNTNTDGSLVSNNPDNVCNDWTEAEASLSTNLGFATALNSKWTSEFGYTTDCAQDFYLYCLQTDMAPIRPRPVTGSSYFVFATTGTIPGDAGRSAMDALCQSEADAGSVTGADPGTYVAWLDDLLEDGGALVDRNQQYNLTNNAPVETGVLAGDSQPWHLGVAVAYSADGLLLPDGTYYWVGDALDNCGNWSESSEFARDGSAMRARNWDGAGFMSCASSIHVLCYRAAP